MRAESFEKIFSEGRKEQMAAIIYEAIFNRSDLLNISAVEMRSSIPKNSLRKFLTGAQPLSIKNLNRLYSFCKIHLNNWWEVPGLTPAISHSLHSSINWYNEHFAKYLTQKKTAIKQAAI